MLARRVAALLVALLVVASGCSGTDHAAARSATTTSTTTTSSTSTSTSTSTSPSTTTTTSTSTTSTSTTTPSTSAPPTTRPAPTTTLPRAVPPAANGSLSGRVVVIDPGHNGANGSHTTEIGRPVDAGGFTKPCNTTGTAGGDYAESTFTWEVARRLAPKLTALGATVILTRTDNTGWGPCVDARGLVAADHHADLMFSIHADGSAPANHGFHVIHPTSIAGFTAATAGRSTVLATDVRDALVAGGFAPSNYIGTAGLDQRGDLGTLNRAVVPAVMVESGNMRNAADLATLRSPDGQERLATAFVAGIVAFLAR